MKKPFSLLLFSLLLIAGNFLTSCKDDDGDKPTPQVGALSGTFSPAGKLTAVTVTNGQGTAQTATLNTAGSYFLGQLSAGSYTVSYTAVSGFDAPAAQTATVVVGDTVVVPAVSVRQTVVPGSRTALLIGKRWKLTGATTSIAGQPFDVYNFQGAIEECIKDNLYVFMLGGVVEVNESTLKCNTTDPQTATGTWALTNGDADLRIVASGQTQEGQLRTISATTFTFFNPAFLVPTLGTTVPVEATFTAQP